MSSSPFELFRRNLKPLMVLLTLLAIFSFVVLPSVEIYLRRSADFGGTDTRLASFDGGEYDLAKVSYFTRTHFATIQFLSQLAEVTIASGGSPRVSGFEYDDQQNQIRRLGINSSPSEQASVRTMMYAAEAKKTGLDLDDTAIRSWLTAFTDGRLSDAEINGVLQSATRNQLGQFHLYEQLRTQLLSEVYQRKAMAGLAVDGRPIVPPTEQWELFLRLNRRAVTDAYAVNVAEFIPQTSAQPSPDEIRRVYEEGKTRFPDEQSPLPAFRRPYAANIQYVAGSLDDFIDRELENLTEEELRAEYQRRLEGGDFKMPEPPAEPTEPAEPTIPAEPTEPTEPTEPAVQPPPAEPTDPQPLPGEETPASDSPDTQSSVPRTRNSFPISDDTAVWLVTALAQDEVAATGDEPADDAPAAAQPDALAPPADSPAPDQSPEPQAPPALAESDPPVTDAQPETEAPAVTQSEEPATQRTDSEPAPAETEPTPTDPAEAQPFDEVREEVARSLAMQPALEKLDAAISEVDRVMRSHFTAVAVAGARVDRRPERPDLRALAGRLGMTYGETGLVDARQVQDHPIASSFGVGVGMQRGNQFLQTMFVDRPPLLSPVRTVDDQAAISYVSWKTEEREAAIPTLDEAREEVIIAIRTAAARELARVQADKLANDFNASDQPIRELIPEDRTSLLFESLGPFSWMSSFGFGMQAFMGNVPELDRVGEEFMRRVFTSERNKWGVASNAPETVFYVVRPTELSPSTDELYQRFSQMFQRLQATSLAVEEVVRIRDGHYEALEKRIGFEWNETVQQ